MAGSSNDTVFIIPNPENAGFPPYLDFTTLRTNAINYLGPITGKYWTDYNVHDPGITTLEVLMYAIVDLGYRVNLPIASLLSPGSAGTSATSGTNGGTGAGAAGASGSAVGSNSGSGTAGASAASGAGTASGTRSVSVAHLHGAGRHGHSPVTASADGNFFTPAQVLGCNPTTVIDYRKLLMDLDEVRNAWLETDQTKYNGLYHIYLETEKDQADFSTHAEWDDYKHSVRSQVRRTLHAFRNLCEDFESIVFLKRVHIGVNIDIEVVPGTDTGVAYQALVAFLYDFFSPVPTFYTLGQLTANNVSLATVFEGRPYTGGPSHGFLLDTEMPVRPSGDVTISKSVLVQNLLTALSASGIRTIRSLTLLDGNGNEMSSAGGKWEYPLPADSLSAFLLSVSTFRWFQNGQLLSTQLGSYNAVLVMNSLHSGKVIYPAGSAALDAPAPYGAPLAGLGDYYSIQNDFPQVYGIGTGGLPPSASVLRQSQAWQFKGYLLFFDQLLADYLAQLSNIRQVFSMNAPAGDSTSFGGNLTSVPDLSMLLRFPPTDAAGGAMLLFPVATKDWTPLVSNKTAGQVAQDGNSTAAAATPVPAAKIDALTAYSFGSSVERDVALATVIVLFSSAQLSVKTFQLDNHQWKYYLAGTDEVFVLVSKNSFANQAGAMGEAATVLYIGGYKENYSLVSLGEIGSYTFNLAASGAAYYQYLQSILENPQEYTDRRTAFVEHLLARFAESFTDYALLESGFAPIGTVEQNQLTLMQRFLSEWPVLSADRGKAFDLRLDGWNSYNTSGLEQRFKAYCGIDDLRRHYLCHFEVHKMDERFHIALTLAEEELFTCTEPLKHDEAVPAVHSLFAALSDRDNYRVVHGTAAFGYWVALDFYGGLKARSVRMWPDEEGATAAIDTLYRMCQQSPAKGDSVISEYQYRAQLLDHRDRPMRTAIDGFVHEREAFDYGVHHLGRINDQGIWTIDDAEEIGPLFPNTVPELSSNRWIDIDGFKVYPRQNVLGPGKVDRWSFEVLDEDNSFRFESARDFDTETAAKEASYQLLHFLCETPYYAIRQEHEDWFKIVIRVGDTIWAHGEPDYDSESSARERIPLMVSQARRHLYHLGVISQPHRWKFLFFMGMPERGSMLFESMHSFESQHDAMEAARDFHRAGPSWKWRQSEEGIYLEAEAPDRTPGGESLICFHPGGGVAHLKYLLETKEGIYRLASADEELARRMVVPDETSKEGAYVYRLVDKDHPWAFHPGGRHETRPMAEAAREVLISRAAQGYVYLEISLGDDNVFETRKFYYRLKCRNDYFSRIGVPAHDGKLVLFESVEGYADAGSAQTAFLQNYLIVLQKAGEPGNYGEKKYIALTDRDSIVTGDDHSPVVLVPHETREALLRAGLDVVGELVKAALSHPIRLADHSTRYRYVLGHEGSTDWNSARDYATAADAQAAFDFFYLLLNFPGNFFIEFDWAACRYRLGIREVLAESTHRFHDEEDAWGPRGVEKFICVAQHEGGIHLNRRHDCSYSWFAACPNQRAMHPCTYESAAQRDRALHQLIQKAGYFFADGWIDQPDVHHFRLLNGRGHPLARVPMPSPASAEHILNRILDIEDAIWAGREPGRYGSGIQLVVGDGADAFAITPAEHWSEKEWMRRLTEVTTMFPVTREGTVQTGTIVYSYGMEMKLPGFEDPPSPESSKDCGCPPAPEGEQPFCYLAWQDTRSFTQATLAWEAWLELLPVLAEKENYRPVFGEQIGCYGIELHDRRAIVARAPQYYSYPAMAVDSATRARAHIDSEGLDIVEHLLLRPERSDLAIPVCPHRGPCASVWEQAPAAASGTDASGADVSGMDASGMDASGMDASGLDAGGVTGTDITGVPAGFPFVAGADPYSFIVTVALPAWPARFRTIGNRVLLESILQREMPAHILARILWLTPRDMCRFEHLYAGWIDGLAREATGREVCGAFKTGEFFQFLFDHAMACLGDCRECGEEPQVTESSDDGEWLSEINHLYCWKDRQCAEKWKPEKPQPQPQEEPAIGSASPEPRESAEIIEVIVEVEPGREVEAEPRREEPRREEPVREEAVREEAVREKPVREAPDARMVRKLQNARRTRYELKIADWQVVSGEEKPAENVRAFLLDPLPSTRRLEDILKEVLKKTGKRAARAGHQQDLAAIVLSIYLDKITIQADEEARWEHLRTTIRKSGIRIADVERFYQEWKPGEMRQLAPDINEEKIRSIMREAAQS